jgi:hypothetical protein
MVWSAAVTADPRMSSAVVEYWLANGDLQRVPVHVRFHIEQLCAAARAGTASPNTDREDNHATSNRG